MSFRKATVVVILLLVASTAGASNLRIDLKHSFWSGWKYSTDGVNYENVGVSANGLRMLMSDNADAIAQLDSYKSKRTTAVVLASVGGVLVGWPLGASAGGQEWTDGYTIMLASGVSLAIVSAIIDGTATGNLKKAVDIHNGTDESALERINLQLGYLRNSKAPCLRLTYSF